MLKLWVYYWIYGIISAILAVISNILKQYSLGWLFIGAAMVFSLEVVYYYEGRKRE